MTLLADIVAFPFSQERVRGLVCAYLRGDVPPPIPIRLNEWDQLALDGDGNHRLAAARCAGVPTVPVEVDERQAPRLRALAEST